MWLSTVILAIAHHGVPLHAAYGQLFRSGHLLVSSVLFQRRFFRAANAQGAHELVHGLRTGYLPCPGCGHSSPEHRGHRTVIHGPDCPACGACKQALHRARWDQCDTTPCRPAPYTIYRGVVLQHFPLTPPPGRILRAPRLPTGIEFPEGLAAHFCFRLCFRRIPSLLDFTEWPITIHYQEAHWEFDEDRKGHALLRAPHLHSLCPQAMRSFDVRITKCGNWVVVEGEV